MEQRVWKWINWGAIFGAVILVGGILFVTGGDISLFHSHTNGDHTHADETSEEVHYHAGFALFKNGKRVDFSKAKYMTVSPCDSSEKQSFGVSVAHGHDTTEHEEQKAYHANDVHLHDGNGQVVHVHADGITWQNFFDSLQYDTSSLETAVSNGERVEASQFLEQTITKHERVVFLDDKTSYEPSMMEQIPSKERIIEVGNESEKCSN